MTNGALPQWMEVGIGAARRRIALLRRDGGAPGLVWLSGFKSDMESTKASAVDVLGERLGCAVTRFDYSGHGRSEGRFEEGTIGAWLEEAAAVFTAQTQGPQIVIGSSMGGYIALLLARHLAQEANAHHGRSRLAGLVLIAPAWNMTEALMWGRFSPAARRAVMADGVWLRPSAYGDPYPITRALIEDGRRHLLGETPFNPGCPVDILHGRLDPDVPFAHGEALVQRLAGEVRLTEIADGEHRLSRPDDIALLERLITAHVARVRDEAPGELA